MKHLKFSQIVSAMKTAHASGHPHATLYRNGTSWGCGAIGSFVPLSVASEELYLLPIVDRKPDLPDDEIRAIAAAWLEGEYGDIYPVPSDLKVNYDEDGTGSEEEVIASLFRALHSLHITIDPPLPCHTHDEEAHKAVVLVQEMEFLEKEDEEKMSLPQYVLLPMCPKCQDALEGNLDSLDAIAAVRKLLGM